MHLTSKETQSVIVRAVSDAIRGSSLQKAVTDAVEKKLAGLVPSGQAARSDPVKALRSE